MRKVIFVIALIVLIIPQVSSLSSTFKDMYAPRETMIGEITGGILAPIQAEQIRVVKDNHLDVAVQYGVGKLGNRYFVWIVAPNNLGNYSIVIRDVVALVNGAPEVIEFRKDFSVQGSMVAYSVAPGIISTSEDFEISVIAYSDSEIELNFPEERTVHLYPGTNYLDFSIAGVLGLQQINIAVGSYQIPARINGAEYICGDGRLDGREVCDGSDLNDSDCTKIPGGFVSGQLKCSSSCLTFDNSLCVLPQNISNNTTCNAAHLNLCLSQSTCISAGGYWYNNSCNRYERGSVCDRQHVGLCLTQGTCLDAGGYWYNNSCNSQMAPVCGSEHLDLCTTAGTCLDAGGYWYNNSCNRDQQAVAVCGDGIVSGSEECDGKNVTLKNCSSLGFDYGNLSCMPKGSTKECKFNLTGCYLTPPSAPPVFGVYPAVIRSKILLNQDIPTYYFRITNEGEKKIVGLRLDYSTSKFSIIPSAGIDLEINESKEFNVSVRDSWRGTPFTGVIIAYDGDTYKYVLLEVNFTNTDSEAGTEYSRNSSSRGPSYYCSELSGISCGSDERCDGNIVKTIDLENCCVGACSNSSESSSSNVWIGYLIAGIVLLVVIILFVKYKKAGNSGASPLQTKVIQARTNLP